MSENAAGQGPLERPVRPSMLTEKELLEIVDSLIRDRAFNRPAAVAIAMAVGAAVEAEVRERCAKKPLTAQQLDNLIEAHVGGAELADGEYSAMVMFAAAVERAHGIGA